MVGLNSTNITEVPLGRIGNGGIAADHTNEKLCTDKDILVGVDLELVFDGDVFHPCEDTKLARTLETIQNTLNSAFSERVTSWNGEVSFGEFEFDEQQSVSNVDDVSSQQRSSSLRPLRRGFHWNRQLQDTSICLDRPRKCPESVSACLFACGVAATTNCGHGETTTDDWQHLGLDLMSALSDLRLDCLGYPNPLAVRVNAFSGTDKKEEEEAQVRVHRYDYMKRLWKVDDSTGGRNTVPHGDKSTRRRPPR